MSTEPRTIRDLIQVASRYLDEKGIESARLNAERLLGDVLGLTRLELYLYHDRPLSAVELDRYRGLIRRRAAGEPLQTLIGEVEFYSRTFKVEAGVFIPRPETEILVGRCVELLTAGASRLVSPVALDVGCGAGVIGVTLAAEIPTLRVFAGDVNPTAVRLTELNARRLGVGPRLSCAAGSLWEAFPATVAGTVDLLASNPPYVRRDEIAGLPIEVARHDPREALDGGPDGLRYYRALVAGVERWLREGAWLAAEIGADQGPAVREICIQGGLVDISVALDYNGHERVVTARWPGGKRSAVEGA